MAYHYSFLFWPMQERYPGMTLKVDACQIPPATVLAQLDELVRGLCNPLRFEPVESPHPLFQQGDRGATIAIDY